MQMSEWAKRINYHGSSVGGAANLINIDPDELVGIAKFSTGLSDFGEDDWKNNFYDRIRIINTSNAYHTLGRLRIKTMLLIQLRNRLFITDKLNKNKNIANQDIDSPLIIIGLPRTGTTILFELLSLDAEYRSPLAFEASCPVVPPSNTVTDDITPKEISQCEFDFSMDIHRDIKLMHDHSHDQPVECQFIMANVLCNPYPRLGEFDKKFLLSEKEDRESAYQWHKKILQLLQYEKPKKTWLLKCLSHIHNLERVFQQYPNARLIHTHRNPASVIPSTIKLFKPFSDSFMNGGFNKDLLLDNLESGLRKSIKQRKDNVFPEDKMADIFFDEFISCPSESIEKAFKKLGLDFDERFKEKISNYLAQNPRYKHGKYKYDIEKYGLTQNEIQQRFKFYTDYYDIA